MIKILKYLQLGAGFFEQEMDSANPGVSQTVSEIIADVRDRGDAALLDYTERFDGLRPTPLAVSAAELEAAKAVLSPEIRSIIAEAAENIRDFHVRQLDGGYRVEHPDGRVLGQRVTPIERVGIYIPGGTASYPSTVLMNVIPAKLAGVSRIVLVTPPERDGSVAPARLYAAKIAGADVIYKCGGAQAIAALAYGTESIERVYKITGPGNIYVAEAKRQVFGKVAIDMMAGPSDVCVIADETANARLAAADMLAQAEHDVLARAILITADAEFAVAVANEIKRQLAALPRAAIAGAAIENRGAIVLVDSLAEAADCANRIAPEHLELCVAEPWVLMDAIPNAGSVFLGSHTPEALGDYWAGPNHTLPTMGTARYASTLSVADFVKRGSYSYYTPQALREAAPKVAAFARLEGLDAHALSAEARG